MRDSPTRFLLMLVALLSVLSAADAVVPTNAGQAPAVVRLVAQPLTVAAIAEARRLDYVDDSASGLVVADRHPAIRLVTIRHRSRGPPWA